MPDEIKNHAYRSPMTYKKWKSDQVPDGELFDRSLKNSFPDEEDRIRFINKFYTGFMAQTVPMKVCVA